MAATDPQPLSRDGEFRTCPVCEGKMELVYNRHSQQVSVCVDCHVGITIPTTAWEIARAKRDHKIKPAS